VVTRKILRPPTSFERRNGRKRTSRVTMALRLLRRRLPTNPLPAHQSTERGADTVCKGKVRCQRTTCVTRSMCCGCVGVRGWGSSCPGVWVVSWQAASRSIVCSFLPPRTTPSPPMDGCCFALLQFCTPGSYGRSWLLNPFLCQAAVATLATRAVPLRGPYARLAFCVG